MLTSDLVKPRLRQRGNQLTIQTLKTTPQYTKTAQQLITLFQKHAGLSQGEWLDALEAYEGDRIDYIVIRGLAKVLMDAGTFEPVNTPIPPDEVRDFLFSRGPAFAQGDLFHQQTKTDLIHMAAEHFDTTSQQIKAVLYADCTSAYRITNAGPDWTPEDLIMRYNLELHRAALYWSNEMVVEIYDTFKEFWRYLKLFKLMFWATPSGTGYHVILDGPISPFVKSTTRYGRQFAGFLPALFLCNQWTLDATVRPPQSGKYLNYHLDDSVELTTHFKSSGDFDSKMEADFAAQFHAKFGDERGQWQLTREDEVILLGDTVMIPDFTVTNKKDGRRVLIEIVGFWHPEYLRRKVEKARAAQRHDLILVVYEGVNLTAERLQDVPGEVVYFKNKPVLKDIMAAIERISTQSH